MITRKHIQHILHTFEETLLFDEGEVAHLTNSNELFSFDTLVGYLGQWKILLLAAGYKVEFEGLANPPHIGLKIWR